MKIKKHEVSLRHCCYILLGWMHVTLIFSAFFAFICNLVNEIVPREAVIQNHLIGLRFFIPVALSWFAVHYLRNFFLYVLASAAIVGVTILLFGVSPVIFVAILICLQRFLSRMNGERHPLLDRAAIPVAILFAVPFLFTVFIGRLDGVYQTISLLFAGIYLLICIAQRGIERIDDYLDVNKDMRNMPERRIVRICSALLCAALLVTGGLLLPALASNTGELRYTPPPASGEAAPTPTPEPPEVDASWNEEDDLLGAFDVEANPFFAAMWKLLEYVLLGGAILGLVFGAFFAVTRLSRAFRSSFRDRGDLVENLQGDAVEAIRTQRKRRERPGLLDFSPNAVVRRKYRKAVLRAAKTPPQHWMSPAEAEAHAGLTPEKVGALHDIYEKARYSRDGCTREDTKL